MKDIRSPPSNADEGDGHACARTTRTADTAWGALFYLKKKEEIGEEEGEKEKREEEEIKEKEGKEEGR